MAALRYFMIKFNLNTVIAFDFKEALNFEGDSGPYLQYTMVRLNSILKKCAAPGPRNAGHLPAAWRLLEAREQELYWEMILNLSLLENAVEYRPGKTMNSLPWRPTPTGCARNSIIITIFSRCSPKRMRPFSDLRLGLMLVFKEQG